MAENRRREVVEDVVKQQQQQPIAFGRRDSIAESAQPEHKQNQQIAGDYDGRNFLLSIPGDIRNLIYQHVFFHPSGIHLHFGRRQASIKNSATLISAASLSLCNRQLNNESKALLYHLNTFHLHVPILQNDDEEHNDSVHEPAEATFLIRNSRIGNLPRRLPQTGEPHLHLSSISARFYSLLAASRSPLPAQVAVTHLSRVLPAFPFPYLRHIELHLGSTREAATTSLPTFHSAWAFFAPALRDLQSKARGETDVRVEFELRVSSRWVVAWRFGINGTTTMGEMVGEIDAKLWEEVEVGAITGMLTIGELENVNEVRRRVVETFFEREEWQGMRYWQGVGRG